MSRSLWDVFLALVGNTDEEGEADSTQLRHGSGVGLLLATWVVDDYGGRLEYDDEGEDGAVVAVELPCR